MTLDKRVHTSYGETHDNHKKDKMSKTDNCTVPGCNKDYTHDAPGIWCEEHWYVWWNWPEEENEPDWMKEKRA